MILGLGTDIVDINRFNTWHMYQQKKLQRIFSEEEIRYCLHNKDKSAERFAVRFAAREALFKAFSQYDPYHKIPFLTLASQSNIKKTKSGACFIDIQWKKIIPLLSKAIITCPHFFLSMSHTDSYAISTVIIEMKEHF